jgi:predicted nucleic acid-binding protein
MKLVLDSSVAFKWVVPESDSDKADRLREDVRSGTTEILAPDVFPAELGHALTRAERQGRILVGQAEIFWADVMTTPPQLEPSSPLMTRAIQISSQLRIGVYDCLYVALVERQGCDFVTADYKLFRNLKPYFPFIIPLASLP